MNNLNPITDSELLKLGFNHFPDEAGVYFNNNVRLKFLAWSTYNVHPLYGQMASQNVSGLDQLIDVYKYYTNLSLV